jgi:hypothetical protein
VKVAALEPAFSDSHTPVPPPPASTRRTFGLSSTTSPAIGLLF